MGFNHKKTGITRTLPIDPRHPDDWEKLNKPWTPENPNFIVWKNDDPETMKSMLIQILYNASVAREGVSERLIPADIIEKVNQLRQIVATGKKLSDGENIADFLNRNWDETLETLNKDASETSPEVEVKEVDDASPTIQEG